MNRRRGTLEPVSGATGPAPLEQPAGRARPNRLSRSYRPSQAAEVGSPQEQRTDFRSPTRIPRSRVSAGFSVESPHNESDCQGDIVWDAASPSPLRPGKRGRGASSGAASISEIVSRIAPKHGRPEVTEPTLQQWIGDSAAIACTPTLQDHRPRRTSPRSSSVDLLELARQFDLHMFRQDEDELDEMQHQSLELLSEDILDFESGNLNDLSPPGAAAVLMDHHTENDLDVLFDGPTQRVSGRLSQVSSQVQPAVISSGKKPAAACSGAANDAFEDDWDDDDLLNDPLVLEMTQSPQRFAAPRHQSTQKPAGGVKHRSAAYAVDRQSAASTVETGSVTQRTTFKLPSSPDASVRTNPRADHSRRPAEGVAEPSRVSNSRGTSSNTEYDRQKRTTGTTGLSATTSTLSFPKKHDVVPSHTAPAAASVDLDVDLDDFFSSDPVWDDPADDDLLCEMCDDVENQLRSSDDTFSKRTPTSNQRAALQPANQQPVLHKQMPAAGPAGPAGPGGPGGPARVPAGRQVNQTRDSFRFTLTESSSGSMCSVQSAAAAPQNKDRVDFMTPSDPVTSGTDTARCSAAEIELKKQQAMERRRRRRRLQASQNRRAPT